MQFPIEPYLATLQSELATTLMPKDDDNAKRIATYAYRILTQLLARANTLPALQHKALQEIDGSLDELNAALRSIDSGMVLSGELIQHIRNRPNFARAEPALQQAVRVLLANPNENGKALLKKISATLLGMNEALQQAVQSQIDKVASNTGAPEVPPLNDAHKASLQAYLRRKFDEPELHINGIKAITGGGSKKTLIINLGNAHYLPGKVVIRADQSSGVVESTVGDEYQLVETLYAEGLPVPQPYALENDAAIIGAPFVVVSCIEGSNIGDHIDVYEPTRSFGLGLARAMGKLHRIPPERFGDKIAGAKTTIRERVARDIASFEAVWRNSCQPSVALELAYAWLKDHMQFSEGRRALNHCDIACHNILAKDGELTALLDWETTIIGNPAHDLAYAYGQAIQTMPWPDFLVEYEAAGGTKPSTEEFDFYRLWTSCWRMSFLYVAQSFFHAGLSTSIVLAYGGQHLYQRLNRDLHVVLNDIYARY